jgi:uncharacterized protein YdcH (DUF465 family)
MADQITRMVEMRANGGSMHFTRLKPARVEVKAETAMGADKTDRSGF